MLMCNSVRIINSMTLYGVKWSLYGWLDLFIYLSPPMLTTT